MRVARRRIDAAVALAALCAGLWIAAHHPVSPAAALAGVTIVAGLIVLRPSTWLFILPATMPLLNFAPWTGWLVVDEFDLCVYAVLAGGYLASARSRQPLQPDPPLVALCAALAGTLVIGLLHGLIGAAPTASGWFAGYADPQNSWRVAKSGLHALLLLPLLRRALNESPDAGLRAIGSGVLAGLSVVIAAVVWERAAYPGLTAFHVRYRTVALFWEMHVGGAAIDVYLALATPFVAWAIHRARSPWQYTAAAALALFTAYACLTTFSRGVYLAVAVPLALLALWFIGRRFGFDATLRARWRRAAGLVLAAALVIEVVAVLGANSYMVKRMSATERDFGSRVAHWQRGLQLLSSPAAWAFGIGIGRLPARYAASGRSGEFSGSAQLVSDDDGRRHVRLAGPPTRRALAGLYSLTQRVSLAPEGAWRVALDVRGATGAVLDPRGAAGVVLDPRGTAGVVLDISVCEIHLLYERQCQGASVRVDPGAGWKHLDVTLQGPLLDAGNRVAPRLGMLAITVSQPRAAVDLRSVSLRGADGSERLENGDFARGLAHWFPAAQYYFLPWHIDNLLLELLIERGLLGLAAFAWLIGWALWAPFAARARPSPMAPFLVASLLGALTVGLVSSVIDVPRVAWLLQFLAFATIVASRQPPSASSPPLMISR